jgi:hypothetical protein
MKEPKKIYTDATCLQAKEDLIAAIRKVVDEFSASTNVMPIIKYQDITFFMDTTGQ